MRIPFLNRETRQESYTDAVVELIQAQAAGGSAASAKRTAALEIALGLWGRAFASATVTAGRAHR